jgi:hypothetical protein
VRIGSVPLWDSPLVALAIDHPRLAALYVVASNCYMAGRIDPGIRYTEAAERAISGASAHHVPYAECSLGAAYPAVGQPQRWIEWCRAQLSCGMDTHGLTTVCLLMGLTITGSLDEAVAVANGLIDAAEATDNPYALSITLLAYGWAIYDANPARSLAAHRRGMVIAQDSGNRATLSHLATNLCRVEAQHVQDL